MKPLRFIIALVLSFNAIVAFGTFTPLPAVAALSSTQMQVMASVQQFIDGVNEGNLKRSAAACASPASVIDDFPPHEWQGPTACADWASGFTAAEKTAHITNDLVTLGKPWHVDVSGDRAYVVVPATYAYKLAGKPMLESGSLFTVALKKFAAGWRITGWAWSEH